MTRWERIFRLWWFGNVMRGEGTETIRAVLKVNVEGKKGGEDWKIIDYISKHMLMCACRGPGISK